MACSQKDMASPFLVDRHKFPGASISFVVFRAHVLFVLCGLLALACSCLCRLHFVLLPLLGQGGVLPFALAIVPWKFSRCCVLSSCCW